MKPMPTSNKPSPPEPWFIALVLDQFSAQVLAVADTSLLGKVFGVIQQHVDSHKTFILAVSPEARAVGLYAGMPVTLAKRRYRNLLVIQRDLNSEVLALQKLEAILNLFSPDFKVKKNGSSIIDVTGTPVLRRYQPQRATETIHAYLKKHLRFPDIVMGTATTRLLAQVLASCALPNQINFCVKGQERTILDPLPPEALPGLSPQCHALFKKYSLHSVGQVSALGKAGLLSHFGKEGEKLYSLVSGVDLQTLSPAAARVKAEIVLTHDLNSDDALAEKVRLIADQLLFQMRKNQLKANRFTLSLRYSDHKMAQKVFQLPQATDSFLPIAEGAVKTFFVTYQRRVALQTITLSISQPKKETGQTNLFAESQSLRQQAIANALEKIRHKNQFSTIVNGCHLK